MGIRAMARLAVAVLVVALLVELSVQRGTIYLNEIQPVPDAITGYTQIPIECTLWDETTVYLDNFNGIPAPGTGNGHGVEVDGVLIDGFSWVFPNELVVGNLFGGRIHLEPGKNGPIEGDIIFGTLEETRPENLFIRRDTDTSNLNDAAPTYIRGQESTGGDGGDLYLVAGDGTDTRSGSIYLQPGVREDGTNTGAVWWGNNANNADLFVLRPPTYIYPGQDTALIAQNTVGAAFVGGDMFVQAGDGATFGGDLNIFAGNGEKEFGGSVFITSTFASTAIHGGDIEVNAGEGRNAGGDIFFFGGNSGFDDVTAGNFRSMGGDIYIHAGAGSGPDFCGRIVFQNGDDFILDAVPIFFEAGDDDDLFSITDTDDSDDVYRMDIFPDGDNGIFTLSSITSPSPLNPFFMLRERQTITGLATPYVDGNPYLSETDLRNLINDIHTAMVAVADALENHGLIDVTLV